MVARGGSSTFRSTAWVTAVAMRAPGLAASWLCCSVRATRKPAQGAVSKTPVSKTPVSKTQCITPCIAPSHQRAPTLAESKKIVFGDAALLLDRSS